MIFDNTRIARFTNWNACVIKNREPVNSRNESFRRSAIMNLRILNQHDVQVARDAMCLKIDGVVHGDLQAAKLMVDMSGHVRLADLEWTKMSYVHVGLWYIAFKCIIRAPTK